MTKMKEVDAEAFAKATHMPAFAESLKRLGMKMVTGKPSKTYSAIEKSGSRAALRRLRQMEHANDKRDHR
jgi:hypothetical protein